MTGAGIQEDFPVPDATDLLKRGLRNIWRFVRFVFGVTFVFDVLVPFVFGVIVNFLFGVLVPFVFGVLVLVFPVFVFVYLYLYLYFCCVRMFLGVYECSCVFILYVGYLRTFCVLKRPRGSCVRGGSCCACFGIFYFAEFL